MTRNEMMAWARGYGTSAKWLFICLIVSILVGCSESNSEPQRIAAVGPNPVMPDGNGLQFRRQSGANRVIVFVHGLSGDVQETWLHERTHAYWPDLIANDSAFSDTDVAVYGYGTSIFERSLSIDEVADNLRLRLDAAKIPKNYDEVVFLAHSMGGIVVRAFALKYRDLVSIPAAYFFATPTNGADLANIASLLSNNRQVEGLKRLEKNLYLQGLSAQWLASPLHSSIRSYCAYETKTTKGVLVVPRASATALCNQRLDPIPENHIRIVKPAGAQADAYVAFKVAYEETFEQLQLVRNKPDVVIDSPHFKFPQGRPVLVGDAVTVAAEYVAPDNTLIVANSLKFEANAKLLGRNLSIVAASAIGGTIDVSGKAGENGGSLLVAAGRILGTRILATGGRGIDGKVGRDGIDGGAGESGRDGDCAGFGRWRTAHAGKPGAAGTDAGDGGNGDNGGDGGTVYLLALNQLAIQPDISGGAAGRAGDGGRGGRGGPGGRGGSGCTGLGGSQSSRPSGADGQDGLDGRKGLPGNPGNKGTVWTKQIESLADIAKNIPNDDEVIDYADDIVRSLQATARGQ